ncbi:CDP-diacylglycerol--glycerol-3-phosphate 3-phosphatidyltransferase [Nocardioides sp. Kera G14]|uniref:CDP-diacylglycerol--glycerol-3-phosphate 3-phosphatidyltransferase n=1 Tax=Nocardioides sp. Kera G14 TaxID=2884264 RepID=UPI001D119CD7|nr:CDP-diacylglycerol--glycerol-3-phosphate 3-phosphatidyltransferase [Nocardioides sp. Kera G14]UDY25072.1 CDP-diacylglycerol--glycerol-3-phosphate 3-phosphatidyltransferase [Nocardioides sp. Kera G14]
MKHLPNLLTALRIVLVPFYGWALLAEGGDNGWLRFLAWGIFFVAMVTDKVDGDLARKYNVISSFGKIADPIADKLLTGMAFIGLSILGDIWWWVTIVVLVREWLITFVRMAVVSKIVLAADQLGKWKTTAQGFALGGLTLPLRDPDATSFWHGVGELFFYFFEAFLVVAVVLTFISGFQFFADLWRKRADLRAA